MTDCLVLMNLWFRFAPFDFVAKCERRKSDDISDISSIDGEEADDGTTLASNDVITSSPKKGKWITVVSVLQAMHDQFYHILL